MTELTDVSGAFGYGDSILAGERVRLRGVRDDDLPALARWAMDPGRMATLSSRVAPPSEAAATDTVTGVFQFDELKVIVAPVAVWVKLDPTVDDKTR